MNKITKFALTVFLGMLFVFPLRISAQDCSFSSTGSTNGDCVDATLTITCDDGLECSFAFGGCDWGDVSSTYFTGSCNQ